MRRARISAVLVSVLGICGSSWGQAYDFKILSVSPPPTVDGHVDDVWATVSKQYMRIDTGESPHNGAEDCSGYFQALYDSDYLYVLIDIQDSELRQDDPLAEGWKDDSAEFYFDGNNSKGWQGAIEADDFQYRFTWNVNQPNSFKYEYFHRPQSLEGVEYMMASTQTGYRFEIKFPWRTLLRGGAVPVGKLIGVDCFINDDDNGGGREHQVAWHATAGTGWNTPQMWGTALIAESKATVPVAVPGAGGLFQVALAFIDERGKVTSGTPNVRCTFNSMALRYEITIQGETYTQDQYVTVVSLSGSNATAITDSADGKLLVYLYNSNGDPTTSAFQFVTYTPKASAEAPPVVARPVAHWKLQEMSGTIAPDSAGVHNGRLYGSPTRLPGGGKVGGALRFDGIDDYVETCFSQDLTPETATAWVLSRAARRARSNTMICIQPVGKSPSSSLAAPPAERRRKTALNHY